MDAIEKKSNVKAILYLIITAVLWSFGGVLIKLVEWNPLAITGMRCIIATPILLIMIRREHLNFSFAQMAGAVCYSATVIMYVAAVKLTTAANAVLLHYTAPFFVAVFGIWLLKEKVKSSDWLIIFIALFGICLFFLDELSVGNMWGNILAVVSGLTFGLMIVFMRMQRKSFPLGSIFIGNIITAVLTLPFMFYSVPRDVQSWTGLVLLGTFQVGLSYMFYSVAIQHVTALEGIMIPLIEPVLNPIWVFWMVRERPGNWAIAGGVVVIASFIVHSRIIMNKSGGMTTTAIYAKTSSKARDN